MSHYGARRSLLYGMPSWVFRGASLDMDFANGRGWSGRGRVDPSQLLTTTRASTAYADSAAGFWQAFSSNVPRITNKGLLVEEARTNSQPNNSGTGASPGVDPTGWTVPTSSATATVTGTGTEDGIDYVAYDMTFTGAAVVTFRMAGTTTIAAADAQAWAQSAFVKMTGGSLTNLNAPAILTQFLNSGGTPVQNSSTTFTPTTASLGTQRYSNVVTASGGTITNVRPVIQLTSTGNAAVSIRIGWPQMELGGFVTSPIRTTSAAATRAADAITAVAPTFGGTVSLYAEGVPQSPDAYGTIQNIISLTDGTNTHRIDLQRVNATALAAARGSGGTGFLDSSVAAWSQNAAGKLAGAFAAGDQAISFNGATPVTSAAATLPSVTATLNLGKITASQWWNGYIRRVAYFPTRLTNAQLQALTA